MEQLRVINDDFNSTDLYFNLTSVEHIINEEWFLNGGPETCSNFLKVSETCSYIYSSSEMSKTI
jgi:hypothetical protein